MNQLPEKQGLYDPRNEHDNCGIGFVAHIKNVKSHDIVKQGLEVLVNLTHRGAVGADPLEGDGAGILIQMPDAFFRAVAPEVNITLPDEGEYGVGNIFLPQLKKDREACQAVMEKFIKAEGQKLLGWRDVPVKSDILGERVRAVEPVIRQVFIGRGKNCEDRVAFERKLFVIRKQAENEIRASKLTQKDFFYIPSLSSRTITYKGMMLARQVEDYYGDLSDERVESALALVHQRFSTNTFPSWSLAQPFRFLCHNGEINTVRGNINWMNARRHSISSELLGKDLDKLWPLLPEGASDSATFDSALDLLVAGGYPLAHAMMLMIPEAWDGHVLMEEPLRAFYEYHAALMEPWDGPAAVAFTDGKQIGATLDRNGLRPARYHLTDDDVIVMASESGVLPVDEKKIVKKWRLQPGKMLLIDLELGRIIDDDELKEELAHARPFQKWLDDTQIQLEELPEEVPPMAPEHDILLDRQQAFGYTQEDLRFFLSPMGMEGQDPVGSMGVDTPLAVLSDRSRMFYDYFKQNFAQVTNPAIDPIREELVMSLISIIGPRPNLLDPDDAGTMKRLEVHQPILSNEDLEKIRHINDRIPEFRTKTLSICYPADRGAKGMEAAITNLCKQAQTAVKEGYNIIILSDRDMDADHIGIPALLATGAVHHHLIREGTRMGTGLVLETGEARQVHHFCCLIGYGAEAVNPYLAFDTLNDMREDLPVELTREEVRERYIKAVDKGMLKVFSKMGISTLQSYCGAQIFDAVGLASDFVEKYFYGTQSQVEGAGLNEIAEETVRRHALAFSDAPLYKNALDVGGDLAFRVRGEHHAWTPKSVASMQHAVRANNFEEFRNYTRMIDEQNEKLLTLRGLFNLKKGKSVSLEEVEPAKEIVKRFATGAMSFGSISWEAHTTLAIAMNRIGGRSNSGEGGEDPVRYKPDANGDHLYSRIKQVASGRFGVTTEYLVNATDLQIKVCQGAKPGEGGQLPGHKVDEWIARVRHSTPGVGLISPPPHHDIYSIEDLAQLIYDLKNVNPEARVSVKLVSEVGVGTVAAGVAKAKSDHVTISGYDGGTGASPITSILHAGSPWEIGLAETHQTLVMNRLRGRIAVQVDGGLRTGRDVVIGALLGADEFGIATAALISMGCLMMRKCHLNTCPVGIATQDPVLRKRFVGEPEHVINFMFFVAEEVREYMAEMGFRTVDEMIGRTDMLDVKRAVDHYKAKGLDFSKILYKPEMGPEVATYNCEKQDHGLEKQLDQKLIKEARQTIDEGKPVKLDLPIVNTDRTVGAMLSGEVARKHGHAGMPDDSIYVKFTGTAGQSFGAFLSKGITFELAGDANDYVGKGLSGGRLIIYPHQDSPMVPEDNIIVGNTVLYGAISGEVYFRGVAGERFCVRNSGVNAVVEGVGDHGCEYMTGGTVVVLGSTGRNFAAGMSGGVAYILDEENDFEKKCNVAMVDLEPVEAEDEILEKIDHQGGDLEGHGLVDIAHDLTKYDAQRLAILIRNHHRYTGSTRAKEVLDNWDAYLPKFVKVVPVDYKRALKEMQERQKEEDNVVQLAGS